MDYQELQAAIADVEREITALSSQHFPYALALLKQLLDALKMEAQRQQRQTGLGDRSEESLELDIKRLKRLIRHLEAELADYDENDFERTVPLKRRIGVQKGNLAVLEVRLAEQQRRKV
jgi:ABC-type phosphate transport system auxiliary subunit